MALVICVQKIVLAGIELLKGKPVRTVTELAVFGHKKCHKRRIFFISSETGNVFDPGRIP